MRRGWRMTGVTSWSHVRVDFGLTWTEMVATRTETEADKPVLAVHGLDVYVAYNRAAKVWVAASHDGGNSFTPVNVNPTDGMGWAQAGGAAIDPPATCSFPGQDTRAPTAARARSTSTSAGRRTAARLGQRH